MSWLEVFFELVLEVGVDGVELAEQVAVDHRVGESGRRVVARHPGVPRRDAPREGRKE